MRGLWRVIRGEFLHAPPAETELQSRDRDQMAAVIVHQEAIFICPADNEPDTQGSRGNPESDDQDPAEDKQMRGRSSVAV